MNKILVVIKREYLQRVRTRAFVIGTIATPILMLALTLLPAVLAMRGGGERHVVVLDQSGDPGLFAAIEKNLPGRTLGTKFDLVRIVVPQDAGIETLLKEQQPEIVKDSDKACVILRPEILDGKEPEYFAKNVSDFAIQGLGRAISSAAVERRFVHAGYDSSKLTEYMKPLEMKTRKVGPEGITEESGQTFAVAFVMLIFIYMTVLLYGISVMRGVIEEKQSRIVEVVISSVKPFQMLFGKLIGIGMVGLTQYVIWVLSALLLTTAGASSFGRSGLTFPSLSPSLLLYFVIYFLLGYFLFATLYALVGSMVSSEEDAQQMQFPVTMLMVVPMMVFWVVMRNPNSTLATTLSMIPFFAPTLMMLRIAVIAPPLWQILLSMIIMLASIVGAVWVAGRVYRVGILMYGKRPTLMELGKWIRYST